MKEVYYWEEQKNRISSYDTPQSRLTNGLQRRICAVNLRASSPSESSIPYKITGRVSVNNLWPLDFESEPFDFKTAKVGQRLKFKQFPAPLPKK